METVLEKHLLENGIITNKIAEKIGKDKKLLRYLENCIADNKFSPDAAIGHIKQLGLHFPVMIALKPCTP